MLKKILITTAVAGSLAALTVGGDACSYVTTAWRQCSDAVEESVPLEFQIDRAREMVRDLGPEVRRAMEVIAREEIELESLAERIESADDRVEKSKRDILRLQSDLGTDRHVFRYAGHSYDRGEVTEDLSRRFARHKVADETLTHLRQMRDARLANLDASRKKLSAIISAQKQLEADIVSLEAKRQLVAVAQASTDIRLDDSRLARAKGLVADIRSRLDVSERLANVDASLPGEIPLDAADSADVTAQVASYFGLPGADEEPLLATSDDTTSAKVVSATATISLD